MIKIIEGNIFDSKAKITALQVNCQSRMGSGLALQVSQIYPHVYKEYLKVCSSKMLGNIQLVSTNKEYVSLKPGSIINPSKQYICNMFCQLNYGYDGKQYTSLDALKNCFIELRKVLNYKNNLCNATIAFPYGLASVRGGANWDDVYAMIEEIFKGYNVEIWKYDKG